ncbi:MAG: DNA2/NAM7 family helicase, partial [Candidatus Omnitrophica bacterium]|nr:DNA2/NAM7 family helicase [Candidatus Omnitrophota bacterium]
IFASDPAQSQVVSLLSQGTNALLLKKHRVKTDQFSYHHSLADLVRGSAPNAVVALTEHYRSDPRIAAFINQKFYDRPQRIQTNLTRSGYKAAFVNQVGGIYWVDVRGILQRRPDGGAENITEREYIQELLSKFAERSKQAGQTSPSIAVISPFKAQADKISDWIKGAPPDMFEVQSGAPLDFSGIEKDIILLSPVVSSGASKEIMESAEMSARWLNLAISRARVAVIVVGDWNFCYHQMAADSAYHHLAKYTGEKCGSVLSSLVQLPLLGGTGSCRRGIYTNPADPSHSRTSLEQMLCSLRGNIIWVDPQFTPQVVELFDEVISREKALKLSRIRLLTSRKQIYPEVGKPILPDGVLVNFSTFLRNIGVHFE